VQHSQKKSAGWSVNQMSISIIQFPVLMLNRHTTQNNKGSTDTVRWCLHCRPMLLACGAEPKADMFCWLAQTNIVTVTKITRQG
jgi:hypothetical protein